MERYGYLYGTVTAKETGQTHYVCLGMSSGTLQFLSENGSIDNTATTSLIRSFLGDIPEYDGYFNQPANESPVAVRYAPMSLRSFPQMPNSIKPLYAMCINGFENEVGERAGKYSHLILSEQNGFYHSEGYTYLDRIFGTSLTSWQDIRAFKEEMDWLPEDFCSAMPGKLIPKMDERDREVVLKAVEGIFNKKTIIIRLEKNCALNRRAWSLLTQIYSLFTPQQVEAFGFSVYGKPEEIARLTEKTGVRIFVLPAEAKISELQYGNHLIIDLAEYKMFEGGEKPANMEALQEAISVWYDTPWEERFPIMENLFRDVPVFDTEKYIQTTRNFLNDPFFKAATTGSKNGTCESLKDLKVLYDSFTLCQKLPAANAAFIDNAQNFLKAPLKLENLAAEALAKAMYEGDEEARELYEFAEQIEGADAFEGARSFGKRLIADAQKELQKAEAESNRRLADAKTERDQAVAAEQARTAQAEERRIQDLAAAKTERDNAVAAEQAVTAKVREEAILAMEASKAERDQAVAAEQARTAQALEAGRQALAEARTERDQAVAAEQARTAQAEERRIQELAAAKTERDNAVAAEQEKTTQALEAGRQALEKAEADKQQALVDAKTERDAAVAAEKQNAEILKTKAIEALKEERQKTMTANEQLQKEQEKTTNLTSQLTEAQEQRDSYQTKARELYQNLQEANANYKELEEAKRAVDAEILDAKKQTRAAKSEAARAVAEAESKIQEADQRVADAAAEADRAREELEDIKTCGSYKPNPKQLLLSALAGFGVAALIFGIILTVVLLNRPAIEEPAETTVPPTTEAVETTAPPTEAPAPTTEPTVPPTEVTEPAEPEVMGYIPGETGLLLQEEIPEIKEVLEDTLDEWLPETAVLEGYEAQAVFVLSDVEEKGEMPERYAVLYAPNAVTEEETDQHNTEATEETTEETEETTEANEDSEELPELVVPEVADDKLVLATEQYVLVLYGEDADVFTALQIFARIIPEEEQVALQWPLQEETVELNRLVAELLSNDQWWRSVAMVNSNEEDFLDLQILLDTEETPFLLLAYEEGNVLLYENTSEDDAVQLALRLNEAGHSARSEGRLVAVLVVEESGN